MKKTLSWMLVLTLIFGIMQTAAAADNEPLEQDPAIGAADGTSGEEAALIMDTPAQSAAGSVTQMTYEAEASGNTLGGNAGVSNC
ncbi:hypothetical protein K0U00_45890, partial [Paenibacillus sepulcri]|nr:hypothetical protein [Paenibacillus sepulcri]